MRRATNLQTRRGATARDIVPLTIGPGNAVQMCGLPWRWLRDFARRANVPLWRVGGKSAIPASALLAALEREAAEHQPELVPTEDDDRVAMRKALGLTLRSAKANEAEW